MKKCCYCRRADRDLQAMPASGDYRPGRPFHRRVGSPTSYAHPACLAEVEAMISGWEARTIADRDARIEALRAQLKASG